MSASGTPASPCRRKQPRTVMPQLADRLVDVCRGEMRSLLREALRHRRGPAPRQLLERADIEIAVMEEALEVGHVACEKAPVLTDAVAAHGRAAGVHEWRQELERTLLRLGEGDATRAHPRQQARGPVLTLVPLVHACEHLVTLVDSEHRPLGED